MRLKKILVPTDLSPTSLAALPAARELARKFGAEILLVFVAEPYALPGDPFSSASFAQLFEEQQRMAERRITAMAKKLAGAGYRCRGVVAVGAPAGTIVETAARSRADLIVMATHGSTGLTHLLLGSVAERVVRTAGCAVLTVPPARRTKRR